VNALLFVAAKGVKMNDVPAPVDPCASWGAAGTPAHGICLCVNEGADIGACVAKFPAPATPGSDPCLGYGAKGTPAHGICVCTNEGGDINACLAKQHTDAPATPGPCADAADDQAWLTCMDKQAPATGPCANIPDEQAWLTCMVEHDPALVALADPCASHGEAGTPAWEKCMDDAALAWVDPCAGTEGKAHGICVCTGLEGADFEACLAKQPTDAPATPDAVY